jgi:hypothetical protein
MWYSQLGVTRHQTLAFCSSSCAHDSMLPPLLARIRSQGTIPMPEVGPLPWPICITLHNVQVPFQYGSSPGVSALLTNSKAGGVRCPWPYLEVDLRITLVNPNKESSVMPCLQGHVTKTPFTYTENVFTNSLDDMCFCSAMYATDSLPLKYYYSISNLKQEFCRRIHLNFGILKSLNNQ